MTSLEPILGVVADDFTGATDIAGLLARSGINVSLRIGVPHDDPKDAQTAAVEVIALKSRTAPKAEALQETRAALNWLRQAGAKRFFWKYCSTFDSTKEGNIGPVAEAFMDELGTDQTIYCPAFPENGRSIFMGNLFVGRQPLSESPMKDHPLTPMRDSNLMRLLTPQVSRPVGLVDRLTVARGESAIRQALASLKQEGVAHVIVDAVANDDLTTIAQACYDMPLMTGGSAVAMPLPNIYLDKGLLYSQAQNPQAHITDAASIVLSGSCSAMTRKQVAEFASHAASFRLDPLELAQSGRDAAKKWLAEQPTHAPKILYATAEPEQVQHAQEKLGIARAGSIVEEALADLAVQARTQGVRRFVVAGGESSGAVTKALGVNRLTIGPEIAPGVPWTFATSQGHPIALALKSGNFGTETFFDHALSLLERQ